MKTNMKLLTIGVLVAVMLSVSMAGCVSNPLAPASKVNDYAKNYIAYRTAHADSGYTVTSSKIVQNGTDAVQVTIVMTGGGYTETYSMNVKEFSNVNDATAFFNSQSFGMTPASASDLKNMTGAGNPYDLTFGHNPNTTVGALKYGTISLIQATASQVFQQDNFVVWGDVLVSPSASSSTATHVTVTVNGAPAAKPVATPVATAKLGSNILIRSSSIQAKQGDGIEVIFTLVSSEGKPITGVPVTLVTGGVAATIITNANGEGSWSTNSVGMSGNVYSTLTFSGNAQYYSSSASFGTYVTTTTPVAPVTPTAPTVTP
jgi:uncharacterized protein (DUF2141 family)